MSLLNNVGILGHIWKIVSTQTMSLFQKPITNSEWLFKTGECRCHLLFCCYCSGEATAVLQTVDWNHFIDLIERVESGEFTYVQVRSVSSV